MKQYQGLGSLARNDADFCVDTMEKRTTFEENVNRLAKSVGDIDLLVFNVKTVMFGPENVKCQIEDEEKVHSVENTVIAALSMAVSTRIELERILERLTDAKFLK